MRVIRRIVKIATVTVTIIVPRFLLSCRARAFQNRLSRSARLNSLVDEF